MSEELVKSVQGMLNEEKWTRATISNYSKSNFMELAAIVENAQNQNCVDELKAACDDHLGHTKNSIIALYISGMLSLKKRTLDNSALVSLVEIFQDNHKPNVVTYLCEAILEEDPNNKFALRSLADCYHNEGNEKVWEIYETLVRVDHEEADLAKLLAEHYDQEGNESDAIDYYRRALHRYINIGGNAMNQIKEIWSKLVKRIPEDIEFFYLVQRQIAKAINEDKSIVLMQELYEHRKNDAMNGDQDKADRNWSVAIDILKLILNIDSTDAWARREIVECFKSKYSSHSRLEDCLRDSGIATRNVLDAISDFEKRIAFDKKNFVFHRYWGVGVIQKVSNTQLTINFGKKHGKKEMSMKMAFDALQPLSTDHIWVKRATKTKEALAEEVKKNPADTLEMIIKSFGNNCDFKRIKAELVPSILSASEWTSWSTRARTELSTNPRFGVNPNDINMYTVRANVISRAEMLASEFKAQKQFFARIDILMKYLDSKDTDKDSELFLEMFTYFTNYLKSFSAVTEQVMASFLVVRKIVALHPHLGHSFKYTFGDLFGEVKDPRKMYLALKDTKNTSIRADFLSCIKALLPNWAEIYITLFPAALRKEMLTQLVEDGHVDAVKKLAVDSFDDYRQCREAVIFFFRECRDEQWFQEAGIPYEKQLVTLIHILNLVYREIANHVDTTNNRKLDRQIQRMLFDEDTLLKYLMDSDKAVITRIYTLLDDVQDLDPSIKMRIRNEVQKKFPDLKFRGAEEKTSTDLGFLVTAKMYTIKTKELEHIVSVEMPDNAKEIDEARAQGDLKENAEYKAAKERQNELNTKAAKLSDEINQAKIVDPASISTSKVSFGTMVTMTNLITQDMITYTILGPWESDPSNNVISFKAPLGSNLLNAKEGEELEFSIGGKPHNYRIEKIEAAQF